MLATAMTDGVTLAILTSALGAIFLKRWALVILIIFWVVRLGYLTVYHVDLDSLKFWFALIVSSPLILFSLYCVMKAPTVPSTPGPQLF